MTSAATGDQAVRTDQRTSPAITIRCVQLQPRIGAVSENIAAIERELERAVSDQVDLLVLPELATSGYLMTPAEARASSLRADAPEIARWHRMLAESRTTAVVGFSEDAGEVLLNSAVALTQDQPPTIYRKLHLWDSEKLLFASGSEAPPIITTPFGRLGVIICYDLEFPELPRTLALDGADVLAVPTNWPSRQRPPGERPHEVIHAMAAAQASGIVIACCDRAGDERGVTWTEGSTVVAADGWPRGAVDASGHLNAVVQLDPNRHYLSERNHLFDDRRPGFYRNLAR